MDPLSICASMIGVAGAGIKLSTALYTYSETVFRADANVKDVAQDIALTSSVLEELGALMGKEKRAHLFSDRAAKTAAEAISGCKAVFDEIDQILRGSVKSNQLLLTKFGKLKWPLKEKKMQYLRSNLDRLKSTLILLLNVLTYARSLEASSVNDVAPELEMQRRQIEELVRLNQMYQGRFLILSSDTITLGENVPEKMDRNLAAPVAQRSLEEDETQMQVTTASEDAVRYQRKLLYNEQMRDHHDPSIAASVYMSPPSQPGTITTDSSSALSYTNLLRNCEEAVRSLVEHLRKTDALMSTTDEHTLSLHAESEKFLCNILSPHVERLPTISGLRRTKQPSVYSTLMGSSLGNSSAVESQHALHTSSSHFSGSPETVPSIVYSRKKTQSTFTKPCRLETSSKPPNAQPLYAEFRPGPGAIYTRPTSRYSSIQYGDLSKYDPRNYSPPKDKTPLIDDQESALNKGKISNHESSPEAPEKPEEEEQAIGRTPIVEGQHPRFGTEGFDWHTLKTEWKQHRVQTGQAGPQSETANPDEGSEDGLISYPGERCSPQLSPGSAEIEPDYSPTSPEPPDANDIEGSSYKYLRATRRSSGISDLEQVQSDPEALDRLDTPPEQVMMPIAQRQVAYHASPWPGVSSATEDGDPLILEDGITVEQLLQRWTTLGAGLLSTCAY